MSYPTAAYVIWPDPILGREIDAYTQRQRAQGSRHNLYRALLRAIVRSRISGSIDDLYELAQDRIDIHGFGPAKRKALRAFLSQYTSPRHIQRPRPRITRTTAEVYASLPPAERAEIAQVAADLDELRRENPLALLPPSATHVYLMERAGWIWDFQDGRYTGASNAEGLQLAGGAD